MAGIFIQDGEGIFFNNALQNTDMHLHLYLTAITPNNATDTWATYSSHEASFTGYSAVTLTGTSWSTPSIVSGKSQSTQSDVTFTYTAGSGSAQVITGYVLTDTSDTKAIAAELFGASRTLNPGDSCTVSPLITFTTQ